jgi:hypothetical protein
MRSNIDMAPIVPMTTNPTTHTTRTDGGDPTEQRGFERPPETTGAEADRHREEIEPGVADLR